MADSGTAARRNDGPTADSPTRRHADVPTCRHADVPTCRCADSPGAAPSERSPYPQCGGMANFQKEAEKLDPVGLL